MTTEKTGLTPNDLMYLRHCLELAEEALKSGDEPFAAILVDENNEILARSRNRVNELTTPLAHPELELAQWSIDNMTRRQRGKVTMYTTGEPCPMCAAAQGWAGIGRLVYLSSGEQLNQWLQEFKAPELPLKYIPASEIIKEVMVLGPVKEMAAEIKKMHQEYYENLAKNHILTI